MSDVNRSDIPYFTVKADGTRDPTNTENISLVVRFVKQGKVREVLIDMTTSIKLDTDALTTAILESLERSGLNRMNLLSQCYDGASVMAGRMTWSTEKGPGASWKANTVRALLQPSAALGCGTCHRLRQGS